MQYNDIKPCNWYIKQDHFYCASVNEHQIYLHIKYIYFSTEENVNPFSKGERIPLGLLP